MVSLEAHSLITSSAVPSQSGK